MIRIGLVGLGKMGLSHLSMLRVHPNVHLVGICDQSKYLLNLLQKASGIATFSNYDQMVREAKPEAVIIAVPSRHHASMVRTALRQGLHVFCEKPFCLDPRESSELASLAESKGLINQVGYHYRFVGAFQEVKRLLDLGAIGRVTHVLAEAYGPVILHRKRATWRTQKAEGGGCLYDYAAHPIDLLNWFCGPPAQVCGTVMGNSFSTETDDEVYSTLLYKDGMSAQLSVNWSDESQRKMSVKVEIWGLAGKIYADRQECQVYLRDSAELPAGYRRGWNVRYTTELTQPVWFYLRGEEYSAQLDHFIRCIELKSAANVNSFSSAAETDRILGMMLDDVRQAAAASCATDTVLLTRAGSR